MNSLAENSTNSIAGMFGRFGAVCQLVVAVFYTYINLSDSRTGMVSFFAEPAGFPYFPRFIRNDAVPETWGA